MYRLQADFLKFRDFAEIRQTGREVTDRPVTKDELELVLVDGSDKLKCVGNDTFCIAREPQCEG
jgi:hypothetical protein